MVVDYDEEAGILSASAAGLTLKRTDNGTKLSCKFVSQHGTEAVCESEPIIVKCKADEIVCTETITMTLTRQLEQHEQHH